MNIKYLYLDLLWVILSILVISCGAKHECVGYWEGGGNSQTHKVYCLSVQDDGEFSLRILPERPEGYVQLYTGPETDYRGSWESISDNEIKLTSTQRTERYGSSDGFVQYKDFMEDENFYLRQDGAFCKDNQNFLYPDVDLMKK